LDVWRKRPETVPGVAKLLAAFGIHLVPALRVLLDFGPLGGIERAQHTEALLQFGAFGVGQRVEASQLPAEFPALPFGQRFDLRSQFRALFATQFRERSTPLERLHAAEAFLSHLLTTLRCRIAVALSHLANPSAPVESAVLAVFHSLDSIAKARCIDGAIGLSRRRLGGR